MHWSFTMLKRLALIATVFALGPIASASAQMSGGVATMPLGGSTGRRAVIREAPPQVVVPNPHTNPSHPSYYNSAPQPVAFTLVPAIIMSDGSIYGNFGFGYEPVLRSCSAVVIVTGQPQRIASNGTVLSNPNPTRMTSTLSAPAQTACFSRDQFGRVFVYRRS
jgi:hypothetical protein